MPTSATISEELISADITMFYKINKFDPRDGDRTDQLRAKSLAFKSALFATDNTGSLRRAIHNAELPEPPSLATTSRQDDDFLFRVLSVTTQGETSLYLISENTGRGSWTTLQRVFARFDISSLLKELDELKSNSYSNVHLFRANVCALHKQYLVYNQNVPQILTRTLRKALRPPNTPPGFGNLTDR